MQNMKKEGNGIYSITKDEIGTVVEIKDWPIETKAGKVESKNLQVLIINATNSWAHKLYPTFAYKHPYKDKIVITKIYEGGCASMMCPRIVEVYIPKNMFDNFVKWCKT